MLYIQDPYFSQSYTLHEALIKSCASSIVGCGAYAFASKSGVDILFKDKEFDALLERGKYSIIVGIDSITNLACLEALNKIKEVRPNLDIKAFFHTNPNTLFHPKISYFKNEQGGGSLIVGSGNLTIGGLRRNREIFGLIDMNKEEIGRIEADWLSWLHESKNNLKEIDDELVINKAKENEYIRKLQTSLIVRKKVDKPPKESTEDNIITEVTTIDEEVVAIEEGWQYYADNEVLLAEIPQSGDRWKQANFDKDTFSNFFGATPGNNNQRILLRYLNEDGSLAPTEIRQSVSVKSQNYRFELDAASGLDYPTEGKPIGLFIRLTTRMFLYNLFMPNHSLYFEIKNWMDNHWQGRSDRMKRIVSTAHEIKDILDKSVFKQYLVEI